MFGPEASTRLGRDLPSPIPVHALEALITPQRARKYRQVLARRTGRIAVVVEDCFDPHNATAIIRTCDAFGVHRVVVSTGRNAFKVNRRVSQGSHFYADLQVHDSITTAYGMLRQHGFRIYASDLAHDAVIGPEALQTLVATAPIALVFGNEGAGVSPQASAQADGHFLIPMVGFTQSLNLSVAVATTLYGLRSPALIADAPGDLSAAEQCATFDTWVRAHTGQAGEAVMRRREAQSQTDKHGEELDVFGG